MALQVSRNIVIDDKWLEEAFIRASGPGGQNVNKVSSAVQLRFDLENCDAIPADVKARARRIAGSRLTKDGHILIEAQQFRRQEANREDARKRLVDLLKKALVQPKPRRKTAPSRAQKAKRLDAKKRRGDIKKNRGQVDY
ncbi:alternative ribosome rescue aminoacyl-tRNA hydrolase ArfB [Aquisalinus flavus]|nr:alternative ribosome rescue aminoacyl-tRNA hydrolase ArfB [Aquisalinus flavus]MBD0427171.1 aminoacyl-tRNA hydrolase [Aquisalinus flavus]UNE46987.1 aminoacyl-tRNA hydrolase [Aquisalinus flavus]